MAPAPQSLHARPPREPYRARIDAADRVLSQAPERESRVGGSCIVAFNASSRLSPRVVASAVRRARLAPRVWIQGDVDTAGMAARQLPDAPHLDEGALAEFTSARCVLWCFEFRAGGRVQEDDEPSRFLSWASALGAACSRHPEIPTCFLSSHAASAAGRTIGATARVYRAAEARLGAAARLHIARPGHIRSDDKGDGASPFDAPEVSANLEQLSRSIAITERAIASALLRLAIHRGPARIHDTPSLWSFADEAD